LHPAAQKPAKCIAGGHWAELLIAGERATLAMLIPQAHMDMATRSSVLLIPLSHKCDRLVLRVGDLFGGMLVNYIPVALPQRIAKLQINLLLTQPGLALTELDRHAAAIQRAANAAHQLILLSPLENVVILVVIADRLKVVVVL